MKENQTPEEATEILARELFVRTEGAETAETDIEVRRRWYVHADLVLNDEYRRRAALLQTSLRRSHLELTWTED